MAVIPIALEALQSPSQEQARNWCAHCGNVESVREIVEQIAKGLQAFHRKEMLHQDLRPANVMIDKSGTVRHALYNVTPRGHAAEVLDLVRNMR